MASRPPPRYVVRTHDDEASRRRRRWWLGAAWLGSLALTVALTAAAGWRDAAPAGGDRRALARLAAENEDLKQQLANLQRSQQVNEIATKALRGTLAEREEEINGLRTDLGFYARLVGGDAQRQGLKVQEVHLQPVAGSTGWNLTASLTQNARRGEEVAGLLTLSVEGLRGDKVVQLDWPTLGDLAQKDGVPFRFKYFQQLHATIVLPPDFRPTRLRIHAQADGAETADRVVAWNEALGGNLTTTTSQGI
ncbi:DUF6776 family protein [Fulvimonas soli]|jgi:hypothetical protein|uniref:Uncharacterized protein n=1 Tax=Fulvimonas soli TaxID=155197 RepID=A0A316IH05_9GAMM|nr:DUF6776 family protein [Fulvimonas soli]PWK92389.1 hypothetical protein C7456_102123 [Fulvimonas soli]TNY25912.1 hypothetical protein BV497_11290 [Fulvimonas soli]